MHRIVKSLLLIAVTLFVLGGPAVQSASACPMCKAATEEDDLQPRAYMYSILFMLGVPGTLGIGMVVGLVALGRKEAAAMLASGIESDMPVSAGG